MSVLANNAWVSQGMGDASGPSWSVADLDVERRAFARVRLNLLARFSGERFFGTVTGDLGVGGARVVMRRLHQTHHVEILLRVGGRDLLIMGKVLSARQRRRCWQVNLAFLSLIKADQEALVDYVALVAAGTESPLP